MDHVLLDSHGRPDTTNTDGQDVQKKKGLYRSVGGGSDKYKYKILKKNTSFES